MTERGLRIKTGLNANGWEMSDFPIVCEDCLGKNPYIRMLKEIYSRQCRICERPYTFFKWKGNSKERMRETWCCGTCAKIKNICQSCFRDLNLLLPVNIRDKFMDEKRIDVPLYERSRNYWAEQA